MSTRDSDGFESLAWSGEHLLVAPTIAQRPQITRINDEDALIVYAAHTRTQNILLSRLTTGAFSRWPPSVGEPIEHQSGDFRNQLGAVHAWEDGSFATRTGGGSVIAKAGVPGATRTFEGIAAYESGLGRGMYVVTREEFRMRVKYRSTLAEDTHVVDCGFAPGAFDLVVTPSGALILGARSDASGLQLYVVNSTGAQKRAAVEGARRVPRLVRRQDGSVLLVCTEGEPAAHCIGEDGALVGEPWSFAGARVVYAVGACGDGLVSIQHGGERGIVGMLTDGTQIAITEPGLLTRQTPSHRSGSVAANLSGSVILFVYVSSDGIWLGRLVAGSVVAIAKELPPPAPNPRPAPAPPQPIVKPIEKPPLGTRDQVVPWLRAIAIYGGPSSEIHGEGDLDAGWLTADNGQGDHCGFAWNQAGLVALGYDHGLPNEWNKPLWLREPEKHLEDLPAELYDLTERLSERVHRLATEGHWITAGAEPTWCRTPLELLLQMLGTPGELGDPSALIVRIARAKSWVLTEADAEELFADESISLVNVRRRAAWLADLGISWPGARAFAQARAKARPRIKKSTPSVRRVDRALLTAARTGDCEAVRVALAAGANIDVRAPPRRNCAPYPVTPLVLALRAGHRAIAHDLLAAGADVNADLPAGYMGLETALRYAAALGDHSGSVRQATSNSVAKRRDNQHE